MPDNIGDNEPDMDPMPDEASVPAGGKPMTAEALRILGAGQPYPTKNEQ